MLTGCDGGLQAYRRSKKALKKFFMLLKTFGTEVLFPSQQESDNVYRVIHACCAFIYLEHRSFLLNIALPAIKMV